LRKLDRLLSQTEDYDETDNFSSPVKQESEGRTSNFLTTLMAEKFKALRQTCPDGKTIRWIKTSYIGHSLKDLRRSKTDKSRNCWQMLQSMIADRVFGTGDESDDEAATNV
jgi:hypothetical protein